jgi:secreted trypsin-like serine protease
MTGDSMREASMTDGSLRPRSRTGIQLWRAALVVMLLAATLAPALAGNVAANGKRQGGVTPQIINGKEVPKGGDPFMAALLHKNRPGTPFDQQYCGGAVIAKRWVLTAAHCMKGQDVANLAVFVGSVDLNDSDASGTTIDVDQYFVNPTYNPAHTTNDAALVHLKQDVPGNITPISLVDAGDRTFDAAGTPVSVSGWGATKPTPNYDYPNKLMQADITIQADSVCGARKSYGKSFKATSMLCAGTTRKPMVDSCFGDSGGPLFVNGDTAQPLQLGIVSWGNGCAESGFPGVYTRLSDPDVATWIRDATTQRGSNKKHRR